MEPQQIQSSPRVRAQYLKALERLSGQLIETWQRILPPDARFPCENREAFFEPFAQFGVALYDAYAEELLSTCPSLVYYTNALNFDLKTRVCNQIYPHRQTPIKTLQDALNAGARGEVPDEWTVRMGESWRLFHHAQHGALDDRVRREFIDLYGYLPELWNRLLERVHTAISRRTIHWIATHADQVASGRANAEENPRSAVLQTQSIFVSYAWTEESKAIVDRLQSEFAKHGIRLLRDREEIGYRDSIRDFMRRLGKGKAVVAIISDKYLKSENCMFEMLEIVQAGALRERIFPIVLADANIYKATGRVRYVRHWEEQIHELNEALKDIRGDSLTNLQSDLNLYADIRRMIDSIAGHLRDMNALSPDQHEGSGFTELIRQIRTQVGSRD